MASSAHKRVFISVNAIHSGAPAKGAKCFAPMCRQEHQGEDARQERAASAADAPLPLLSRLRHFWRSFALRRDAAALLPCPLITENKQTGCAAGKSLPCLGERGSPLTATDVLAPLCSFCTGVST